jgi:hypothetical protein
LSLSTKAYKVTIRHPMWPGRSDTFHFDDLDAPQRFMRFWIGIGGDADFEHVLHLPPPEPWPGPPPVDGGGMSLRELRDRFAAMVLPAVIDAYLAANGNGCAADHALRNAPALAYKYADAMLKAREQS